MHSVTAAQSQEKKHVWFEMLPIGLTCWLLHAQDNLYPMIFQALHSPNNNTLEVLLVCLILKQFIGLLALFYVSILSF